MPVVYSRIQSRYHTALCLVRPMTISQSLFFITLIVLRNTDQIFYRRFCNLSLSNVFLMIRLGHWVSRKTPQRWSSSALHITSYQWVQLSTWFTTGDIYQDHLVKVVFAKFLFSHTLSFRSKSLNPGHTWEGRLAWIKFHLVEGRVSSYILFGITMYERFASSLPFIYLSNHLVTFTYIMDL